MFGRRLGALAAAVGIAAAIVLMSAAVASASASAAGHSHLAPVVRPRFRYVGDAAWIWAGAHYALSVPFPVPERNTAALIDDQTGQVRTLGDTGCWPLQISALEPLDLPWVPCASPLLSGGTALYSPGSGQLQPVAAVSVECAPYGCYTASPSLVAAGRYWLAYSQQECIFPDDKCFSVSVFQNIQTGEVAQDPSGGSTAVDLNAPKLTVTLCPPLTMPTAYEPYAPERQPGSLTLYGSFALAIARRVDLTDEAYLERCGTDLHRLLAAPVARPLIVAANVHEVVWMANQGHLLNALTLPGLRPFKIRLPNRLLARNCADTPSGCLNQIALTNYRLYVLTATGHVWAASNPGPTTRRHHKRRFST